MKKRVCGSGDYLLVYVGISAGAMVAGKRLDTPAFNSLYPEEKTYGIKNFFEYGDFVIIPHFNSDVFPHRKEKLLAACKHHAGTIYALTDEDAIAVNGEKIELLGNNIVTIKDGEVT